MMVMVPAGLYRTLWWARHSEQTAVHSARVGVPTCAGTVLGAGGRAGDRAQWARAGRRFTGGRAGGERRRTHHVTGHRSDGRGWEERKQSKRVGGGGPPGQTSLRRWHVSRALKEVRKLSREMTRNIPESSGKCKGLGAGHVALCEARQASWSGGRHQILGTTL